VDERQARIPVMLNWALDLQASEFRPARSLRGNQITMKKTLYLGASVLAIALAAIAPASSADMYRSEAPGGYKDGPVPYLSWTGFYVGVNAGYGWSAGSDQFAFIDPEEQFRGLNPKGAFGGGQIGYNWQMPGSRWVVGAEADIQASGIGETFNLGENVVQKSNLDWFGTVRGRIGHTFDASLFYGTGGLAYGRINDNVFSTFKKNETVTGYVLGGGYEYRFRPAWSLKAEYQYINLGKNDPTDGNTFRVNDDAFHTVRIGLNYHMLPSYEPLK
jgi:outer membrane immunogenic protein